MEAKREDPVAANGERMVVCPSCEGTFSISRTFTRWGPTVMCPHCGDRLKYRLIPVFTVTLAVALVMLIGGFLLLHSFAGWNGNQIIILLFAFEVLILIGWWVFADRLVTLQIHTSFGVAEARRKSENLPRVYRYCQSAPAGTWLPWWDSRHRTDALWIGIHSS